jgi:hypothetical protein
MFKTFPTSHLISEHVALLHCSQHLVELRASKGVAALSSNQEYLAAMRYYTTFITTANAQNAFRQGALPPLLSDQVSTPQAPVTVVRPPMATAAQPSNTPANVPMPASAVASTPAGSTSTAPAATVYKVQPPTMVGRQPALPAVHQLLAQPIFPVRASDYPAESPLNPVTPFAGHKYKCMTRRQHTQLLVQLMIFGNFVRGHSVPTSLMDGFRYFFNRGLSMFLFCFLPCFWLFVLIFSLFVCFQSDNPTALKRRHC